MLLRLVFILAVSAAPGLAQTAAPPAAPSKADAFYEFLMARRLEAAGDTAGATAALERAQKLDPESAEIVAEIAAAHARQNAAQSAVLHAERALKLDANNIEAHQVLARIYSAWADGAATPPAGQTVASTRTKAIEHLMAIQRSPVMAVDPNLQMTLGRMLLRAGRAGEAVPIFERVAAQAPWVAVPLALLYEAHLAEGKIDEAEEALLGAAQINPRYWAQLGQFFERRGKWSDAAEAYGEAVANLRQPSRDLQLRLAAALINVVGARAKAREVLSALLKTNPDDARALYLRRASNGKRAISNQPKLPRDASSPRMRRASPDCRRSSPYCSTASITSR